MSLDSLQRATETEEKRVRRFHGLRGIETWCAVRDIGLNIMLLWNKTYPNPNPRPRYRVLTRERAIEYSVCCVRAITDYVRRVAMILSC